MMPAPAGRTLPGQVPMAQGGQTMSWPSMLFVLYPAHLFATMRLEMAVARDVDCRHSTSVFSICPFSASGNKDRQSTPGRQAGPISSHAPRIPTRCRRMAPGSGAYDTCYLNLGDNNTSRAALYYAYRCFHHSSGHRDKTSIDIATWTTNDTYWTTASRCCCTRTTTRRWCA